MKSCDGLDLGSSATSSTPWIPFHHLRSVLFRCEEGKLPGSINPYQSLTTLGNISWNNNNDGSCCCSVSKLCLSLCDPLLGSTLGSSVFHCLLTIWAWVCSNSCPLSQWCYLTIASSVIPFSFCLQSFPASGSFPLSWFSASGGQSIRASASATVLLMDIQGWFPLGLTGLIFCCPRDSQVFSSPTIWKYQFFDTQSSLWSSSHIYMWLLEK